MLIATGLSCPVHVLLCVLSEQFSFFLLKVLNTENLNVTSYVVIYALVFYCK